MCWYVIHQQWPLPPVMLHCTNQGCCEENHCHSKPNRQHVHFATISMYMLYINIPWYSITSCDSEVVHGLAYRARLWTFIPYTPTHYIVFTEKEVG